MPTVGMGFYWQDLTVGYRFKTLNRTITDADIAGFIGVSGRVGTLFSDLSFTAAHNAPQARMAPAALSYTLIESLLVQTTIQTTGLALLEIEKKVLQPVFAGDTIHAEVEVLAVRPTRKGNRGIVTTQNDILNQHSDRIMTYRAVRMMAGRSGSEVG